MLSFLESQMGKIAPNVAAIVGSKVASLLIGATGGIIQLSRVPGQNIQVSVIKGRGKMRICAYILISFPPSR